MRNIKIIIAVIIIVIIEANIGYFMYDGSARAASQSINYQVGE